jgi:hypothetical protein
MIEVATMIAMPVELSRCSSQVLPKADFFELV